MKSSVSQIQAWVKRHGKVSEAALAQTLAEYQGEVWRYNADTAKWLQWVGTHWAKDQTLVFLDAVRNFMVVFTAALNRAQVITAAEGARWQSQRSISAVEKLCRGLPSFLVRDALFDANPFLLGTPGGTVDLRTGELWSAEPEDYITILTPVTPAPPGTPAPQWLKFLMTVTGGDLDLIRTLQQWAGCGATGSTRDHKMLVLFGSGRNGKGVYCRAIEGVLGAHVAGAPRDLFMEQRNQQHPTALVRVALARTVFAHEVPEGASWDTTLIKQLTGGDPIEIRRMKQDFFSVRPSCSVTIQVNDKPELKSVDDAIRERIMLATFPVYIKPEDRIPDFEKILISAEGPAILRWVIDGAVSRETDGKLFIAGVIAADTDKYMAEENIIAAFIEEYLGRDDPQKEVETRDVFDLFGGFCRQSGRKILGKNVFTTRMGKAGIKYRQSNGKSYFTGTYIKFQG